jgi:adenylate kinase
MTGHVIIFLGPPGSGKGTQAAKLSGCLGIPAISTGELLRQECKSGSELGRTVRALLDTGQLVGDDLMNRIVADRISREDCQNGCILDGYPRTVAQAHCLDEVLSRCGNRKCTIFHFSISGNEVVERLSRRRQCGVCGRVYSASAPDETGTTCDVDGTPLMCRDDDNPATILERLRIYRRNSAELVRYYRQADYHLVMAGGSPADVEAELLGFIGTDDGRNHRSFAPALAHAAV